MKALRIGILAAAACAATVAFAEGQKYSGPLNLKVEEKE